MNKIEMFAQLFGILGSISMMLSNWQKSKNKMMLFLTFDSILYFIQYMLLRAYTGAFTNVISFFRVLIFSNKDKMVTKHKNIALYIILLLYITSGILTYNSIIDCLPILATLVYTIFLWQDNIQRIRIGSSIMFSMWMVYDIVVKAYFGAFFECFLLITSILSIIKLNKGTDNKIIKI